MASRSNAILPEPLKQVLDLRKTQTAKCRSDVEAALVKYGLVRTAAAAPAATQAAPMRQGLAQHATHASQSTRPASTAGENSRFMNLGQCAAPEGWRSKNMSHSTRGNGNGGNGGNNTNDDWVSVSSGNKKRYGKHSMPASASAFASSAPASNTASNTATTTAPSAGAWRSSRFQPLEETITTESQEDRIMGKVRAKVNKLGHSTYDATKAFMQQILDSGETDFLEEFMRFVFTKAATETPFCGLYARFLHELADEFSHLREVMVRKFREYTRVFDEASRAPDVGTSDYKAFVEAQEQKKFRRGYSQFVAELAKLGEVSMEDFRLLVRQVVETIQVCHTVEDNRLMCEEVIDCFRTMVQADNLAWMKEYVETLRSIAKAPRETSPGLSNKGRFAIMDILDLVEKRR